MIASSERVFLEGENYRQHLLYYLGESLIGVSQGATGIWNRFPLLQQSSFKTLLTCIALYDKLFFKLIVAQNGSLGEVLFFSPLPFSISSGQSPQGLHYIG